MNDVENYFINSPLYAEFDVTGEPASFFLNLFYLIDSIDSYCPECKTKSVFQPIDPEATKIERAVLGILSNVDIMLNKIAREPDNKYYIRKQFRCSRNSEHRLTFFFLYWNNKLTKIGQHPSVADLVTYEIESYKKILGDEYYKEFNRAIGLAAHGIGVGSFVYLRRIIENLERR
jgi:hypothetical protein